MTKILLRVAATLLAAGLANADDKTPPKTLEELQSAIQRVQVEGNVPAVGIAMVDENGPVWVDAIGKADLDRDIAAAADSMFRIGSTTKMLVSLSVLKLVEEGRLSLDDRLAELAPDVEFENPWADTHPVRIVHLLEHTTGWDDIHLPEYAHNDPRPATLKEGLDFHPHSRVSRWPPGTRMSYCNSGPAVAAYVIEKVTGQDYEAFVQENFFDPLGMETMTFRLSEDYRAKGVTLYANNNQRQEYSHLSTRPSGSINASPRDMAKLVAFFVNRGAVDGEQLVSRESIDRMETPMSTTGAAAGVETGYGLSNYSSNHESWVFREHGGGVPGGLAQLAYLPEAGVGYAVMINSDNYAALYEITQLVRKFETRNLVPPPPPETVTYAARSGRITGLYQPINSRQQVGYFLERVFGINKLWFEDDRLIRQPLLGGPVRAYLAASANLYRHEKTGALALARVEDPLAGSVVHVNSLVLRPVSAVLAYGQLAVVGIWGICIASSILFFFVWGVRKLRGGIPAGAATRVRVWPLLAGLSVLALIGMFSLGMADPFDRLAAPTPFSIGIMLSSIAFAVFAILGIRASIRSRHLAMNRWAYWHSTIGSSMHIIVAAYLSWFGVIGLMTWA